MDKYTIDHNIDGWPICCDGKPMDDKDIVTLLNNPDEISQIKVSETMSDKDFLQWIHDRLVNMHYEKNNVDYMIRFRSIINKLTT